MELYENIPGRQNCRSQAPGTVAHVIRLRNGYRRMREKKMETSQREEAGRSEGGGKQI